VLPILHLNGYKIANPTVLARISRGELQSLLRGYGYEPRFVEGPTLKGGAAGVHQSMAAILEEVIGEIRSIQKEARGADQAGGAVQRPRWPMIVLRTPKGWTGPGELFDEAGRLAPELRALAPKGRRRMGNNPSANGGLLLQDLVMPAFRGYAVSVPHPGKSMAEATRTLGGFLRDIVRANPNNFRVFGPDETSSNRLGDLFEATARRWVAETLPEDADGGHLSPDGRVMEILSEHTCQGWLEGYLLTGRHGLFNSYEAFIHVVDSMFNQHAKWLKVTSHEISWRKPIASLNYLLTSHVWRQDHNGFSHQDPGFIDHVMNKKGDVIRVYLPPDANTLLSVADHCLRSRNYVNVIVAGKQPALQYLDMDAAVKHCTRGIDAWDWAGTDRGGEPDVVLACAGDIPTLETLAAADLLRRHFPLLKVRVINVLDLAKLQPPEEHPHGLAGEEFDRLFTTNRPIIFAYHGYPWLIHRLTYRRTNHDNLHVRGYKEEGTTTTPFDMVVLNDLDRFHLVMDVIARVPGLAEPGASIRQLMQERLSEHRRYIERYGEDLPEVRDWIWPY
jgi:xylulose-5-phosphate/fructose-6-phosphate phosphoketolase